MSANGDYVSILHMNRDLITTVSQEFVLQFYTIMNKHPESLHRFYKEESTLIRDDICAQGQQEIHKYYMKLNLTNCKAIVLCLDAAKSHNKSVLIQVTGEIANNGKDLRRFMQSFVLVEQGLGNFFVLNDIFRYQDQTFKAEDIEEHVVEPEPIKEEIAEEHHTWSDMNRNCDMPSEHIIPPNIMQEEERKEEFNNFKALPEEKEPVIETPEVKEPLPEIVQKIEDSKEKSWAAVLNPSTGASRLMKPTVPVAPQPQATKQPVSNPKINSNGDNVDKRKPRFSGNSKSGSGSGSMNYPDELQLFVGNLPQNMSEKELKEFFSSTYGPVRDVRIQKSRATSDGKSLPNFGFLVFTSSDVVDDILKHKPIFYNSHRLNVEQKQGNSRSGPNSRR